MARSLLALTFLALCILEPIKALNPAKKSMCAEVCWINDIENRESCEKRCEKSPRPTDEEATYCENCIANCGAKYFGDNPNMLIFAECRTGCFRRYFPTFYQNKKVRRDADPAFDIQLETNAPDSDDYVRTGLPGVPAGLQKLLAGQPYPVTEEICEISCMVKNRNTILADESDVLDCQDDCMDRPTPRDQQLQVSLDCSNACGSQREADEECLKTCVTTKMQERRSSALNAPPRPARVHASNSTKAIVNGQAEGLMTFGDPHSDGFAGLSNSTASAYRGKAKATTLELDNDDTIKLSSGSTVACFHGSGFYFHAFGSLVVAAVVGLHLV